MKEKKKFIKLTPFKMQVLQSFPFIDADFDAITNYELLCKVVEYLNITTSNVDVLNDEFKELYDYVHDYFDNLDVQEEVNNKLDEMAESGQLTEIITAYLQLSGMLTYNSVSDMANSTNLISGSFVRTFGFYNYNDGGGSYYKIRDILNTDVIDGVLLVAVNDPNLVAELVFNECNVKQFGAKGDGETDDTEAINLAISQGKNIIFPSGDYVVSESFDLETDNIIINGNNATIKPSHAGDCFNVNADNIEINNLNIDGGCNYGYDVNGDYCKINNCTISNTVHNAIMITGSHNVINGVTAIDCGWDCVGNYGDASYNIIQNSNAIKCKRHGFSTDPTTRNISFINCYCENIGDPRLDEGHSCFHFEYSNNGTVRNCHAIYNGLHVANTLQGDVSRYVGVRIYHSDNVIIDNFRVEYTSDYAPLNATSVINVDGGSVSPKILNSTLINNSPSSNVGYIYIASFTEIYNTKMYNVYISEQDGYVGQIKVLKDCNIELTNKNNFANFKYLLENAIISGNKFKGHSGLDNFIVANFVNCIIKDNIFDTGKESIRFSRDIANASSVSRFNRIEDCTFKDCDFMFNYLYGENGTNYMNRCMFTGTCNYVIVGNYNSFYMTNCFKKDLTVNNDYGYALYFQVYNDLKTQFDFLPMAVNSSGTRYNISINNSGQVIATQQ